MRWSRRSVVGGVAGLIVAVVAVRALVARHHRGHWTAALLEVPAEVALPSPLPDERLARKAQLAARNLAVLTALSERTQAVLSSTRLVSTPEYLRTFGHVVVSVHLSDVEGGDPLHRHRPVLTRLPAYTQVAVFAPEEVAEATRASLAELGLAGRARVHPVRRWEVVESGIPITHDTTTWAQDLFEAVTGDDGIGRIVVPASHNQLEDLARPDNDYLEELAEPGRREVLRLPIFFRPGNLLPGLSASARTLFVGSQEVEYERSDTYASSMFSPPAGAFLQLLDEVYGTSRHVVLPNTELLFHVDMAIVLLPRQAAGVIAPIDPEALDPADREALARIRDLLASEGFRVVDIPTATAWMRAFDSPVNVLPYTDRRDGRLRVLVPTYPEPAALGARARGLNARVRAAYEAEGFEVVPIEDRFDTKHGDIHCAFNVLD